MMEKVKNSGIKELSNETIGAIFIIVFTSAFVLANIFYGFILPLYLVSMLAMFLIATVFPRSGIYATVFLTFIFERFFTLVPIFIGRNEYKIYPLDILFIAIIFGIILQFIFKKINFSFKKIDAVLGGFIFLSGIYFLIGEQSGYSFALSFSAFKYYAFYPLFYFATIILFRDKKDIIKLFQFALVGAVGILFFIFYGILNSGGLWTEFTPLSTEGIRILAFTHAFYLSLAVFGASAYIIGNSRLRQNDLSFSRLYYILTVIWIAGIAGSLMRHLWLSVIIGLVAIIAVISREERAVLKNIFKKYILAGVIFAVFVFYALTLFPNSKIDQFSGSVSGAFLQRAQSFSNISGDESFSWRETVWKAGIKELVQEPLTGIGFGKKIYVEIGKYRDFIETRNIHNSLLVILVQMGVISFGLFVWFIFYHFKNIFLKKEKNWIDYAIIAMLATYLTAFLFQPYLEANMLAIFFWMIIGLARISLLEARKIIE